VNLHPVAVVLDFMEPKVAFGRFGLQGGKLGFNEPRHLNTLCHAAHLGDNGGAFLLTSKEFRTIRGM
jgi:hypothetical protein